MTTITGMLIFTGFKCYYLKDTNIKKLQKEQLVAASSQ